MTSAFVDAWFMVARKQMLQLQLQQSLHHPAAAFAVCTAAAASLNTPAATVPAGVMFMLIIMVVAALQQAVTGSVKYCPVFFACGCRGT